MNYQRSSALFNEAKKYIPGGVNSPVRAFTSVGGNPIFIKSAKGAYLFDEDSNSYIDYINSWGPMIMGHNHPEVVQAVKSQIDKGFSYGTPTELETEIAKLIISMVPNIDKIRMVNSGTEACMSAIRLARGYTKKDKFIKFEGCYHGHADAFLIKTGSGGATFGLPNSAGVTQGTAKDTLLAPYNNLDYITRLFEENKDEIAALIIEPVAGNMGCIPPQNGFLEGVKTLCIQNNTLLIFDEVMTGFRLAQGGAQELYNIKADIVCFGKIIGGGMPVGAFAANDDIMKCLAPLGSVYQAGTLSGNPIAMRAGLSTLELVNNNEFYVTLNHHSERLHQEIEKLFINKGIAYQMNRVGSMFSIFFSDQKIIDFDTAQQANHNLFNTFFHLMLKNGVYIPPSGYETWFISASIQQNEMEKTLKAIENSLKEL